MNPLNTRKSQAQHCEILYSFLVFVLIFIFSIIQRILSLFALLQKLTKRTCACVTQIFAIDKGLQHVLKLDTFYVKC